MLPSIWPTQQVKPELGPRNQPSPVPLTFSFIPLSLFSGKKKRIRSSSRGAQSLTPARRARDQNPSWTLPSPDPRSSLQPRPWRWTPRLRRARPGRCRLRRWHRRRATSTRSPPAAGRSTAATGQALPLLLSYPILSPSFIRVPKCCAAVYRWCGRGGLVVIGDGWGSNAWEGWGGLVDLRWSCLDVFWGGCLCQLEVRWL